MNYSALSPGRLALAALVLISVAGTAACGGAAGAGGSSGGAAGGQPQAPLFSQLPPAIQSSGAIKVASNVEYPPFESFDTDGKTIIGVDREIADALEKKLGVTLVFENISFDAIIPGLDSGRYDMGMSAMSDTAERQKQVTFLDYFSGGPGIMTSSAKANSANRLDQLCGAKVGVVKGTTEDADASAQSSKCQSTGKPPLDTTVFASQNQAVLALQSDRVDAFLVSTSSGSGIAADSNGALVMGPAYSVDLFGIVFPKESTELIQAVQKGMDELKTDGTYSAILDKYKMADHEVEKFTINGAGQ